MKIKNICFWRGTNRKVATPPGILVEFSTPNKGVTVMECHITETAPNLCRYYILSYLCLTCPNLVIIIIHLFLVGEIKFRPLQLSRVEKAQEVGVGVLYHANIASISHNYGCI